MPARISRRRLLGSGALAAGSAVLGRSTTLEDTPGRDTRVLPAGELRQDPRGLLDLPPGFRYRVISESGSRMTDGRRTPGDPDGMAALRGPGASVFLVRNHELRPGEGPAVEGRRPYDRHEPAGTTTIVVDRHRLPVREFVTSAGTRNNCSGAATPWGTWLTGEETRTDGHGYVFEIDPREPESRLSRTPIRAMGFFSHEALAVDPRTGVVDPTEDDFRGQVDHGDPGGVSTRSRHSCIASFPVTGEPGRVPCTAAAGCRPSRSQSIGHAMPISTARERASAPSGGPSTPRKPTPTPRARDARASIDSRAVISPLARSGSPTPPAVSTGSDRSTATRRRAACLSW